MYMRHCSVIIMYTFSHQLTSHFNFANNNYNLRFNIIYAIENIHRYTRKTNLPVC